jgi:deferrochelatase/peroxidase EfeB
MAHPPGVVDPQPPHVELAAFDVHGDAGPLLATWDRAAAALTGGGRTVTLGIGPGLLPGRAAPVALRPLPAFAGDALDPARSGGDAGFQVCAPSAAQAAEAVDELAVLAGAAAHVRWRQAGVLGRIEGATPRGILGFKDGSMNPRLPAQRERHVWVGAGDRTWMQGGTYLVYRRIRIDLGAWRRLPVGRQETIIGRRKVTGAPFGGRREFDPRLLELLPEDAHVRQAAPATNDRATMLRRSYDFAEGTLFLCFVRDPRRQFVPVQRRLAAHDALSAHAVHTASAVFAVPPPGFSARLLRSPPGG